MSEQSQVRRETWVAARAIQLANGSQIAGKTASVDAGGTTAEAFDEIDNVPLSSFNHITVALVSAAGLAGTLPTFDVYLQRPLVPNADPNIDAQWADYAAFPQMVDAAYAKEMELPAQYQDTTPLVSPIATTITEGSMAADSAKSGDFYDRLRIKVKSGGTITGTPTFNVYVTGSTEV